jgi:hypothetical protein
MIICHLGHGRHGGGDDERNKRQGGGHQH